ncbi:hypothetical protein [Streptomyces badius]|uniref:Uncharacterized protein n=1 Tax=Streptomyces badius TaxID=1941 RepID=A0ABQ2TPK7_STRBA|nr:hypothetical protein [Streptomyces badius]GGS83259.1 hypothetical protein GCM10010253_67300 [Streptomyces badius]
MSNSDPEVGGVDPPPARRSLGPGPETSARPVRATAADLLTDLPGIHFPDLDGLRARGALGARPVPATDPRRTLGTGPADAPPPAGP